MTIMKIRLILKLDNFTCDINTNTVYGSEKMRSLRADLAPEYTRRVPGHVEDGQPREVTRGSTRVPSVNTHASHREHLCVLRHTRHNSKEFFSIFIPFQRI